MNENADELRQAIEEITETLKHWMPDLERACLVADRRELREQLAKMEATK